MQFKQFPKLLLMCCLSLASYGQDNWKQVWSVTMDSTAVWDIDNLRNCYVYMNQTIKKIDTQGKTVLQESYKSLGEITKIDAQNPLKIACFSEGQQRICFLDNALALQNTCLDLNELHVALASSFSASLQTDRIWIYDEPNSQLLLVTIRTGQSQQSQNVKGLLALSTIMDIQEDDNRLFLFDDNNQVAWFDQFGNFMDYVQLPAGQVVYPYKNSFLVAQGNTIYAYDRQGKQGEIVFQGNEENTAMPIKIRINSDLLFVQTTHSLTCYRFTGK